MPISSPSLAYHDQKQTGDLITRYERYRRDPVFIASGLLACSLSSVIGMVGVMFYINWRFTLIACP
jgi:subfamily B ATP-binding cassette protein MsbA